MTRRAVLRVLAFVALVVAGATFAFAAPAQASTDPVVVSPDGVSYDDNLPASLFAGALIVPGKSVTRSFWVKNQYTDSGNLAIALKDVMSVDATFLAALTLQLKVGSTTGTAVVLSSANPCRSLASGILLAPGAAVRVDATLSLSSSLTGVTSQGSVGGFNLPVLLTSTDVTAPDGCGPSTPVTPPTGGGGGGSPHPGGGSHGSSGSGTIGTIVISGATDGSVEPPAVDGGPLSGLGGKGSVRGYLVIPNTGRFWQEFDITGYLVLFVLGGIFAWWWRRRQAEEESYA